MLRNLNNELANFLRPKWSKIETVFTEEWLTQTVIVGFRMLYPKYGRAAHFGWESSEAQS